MKWFKLDSDFYNDDKVIEVLCHKDLGYQGLTVWIFLMSYVSEEWKGQNLDETFIISIQKFKKSCKISPEKLNKSLTKLSQKFHFSYTKSEEKFNIQYPKFLKKQESYFRGVLKKSKNSQTQLKIKDKDKDKDLNKNKAIFDFGVLWKKYPDKDGKKGALKHFNASVKTEQDFSDIQKALDNYLNSPNVKKGYIKKGSTWFNNWQDWIDFKGIENGKTQGNNGASSRQNYEEKDYTAGAPPGFFV